MTQVQTARDYAQIPDRKRVRPATLAALRDELSMSEAGMARALGVSRQSYADYEDGKKSAPFYVGLAAAALKKHLNPLY